MQYVVFQKLHFERNVTTNFHGFFMLPIVLNKMHFKAIEIDKNDIINREYKGRGTRRSD